MKNKRKPSRSHSFMPLAAFVGLYFMAQAAFSFSPANRLPQPPPPANDLCENASEINIAGGGFDTGAFQSAAFDMTAATVSAGEYFTSVQLFFGLDKKSVWFKFTLPTAREVKVSLKQNTVIIPIEAAGYAVYKTADCGAADSTTVGDIPSASQFAGNENWCLEPGTYLIQVCGKAEANGPVFIELEVNFPFATAPTNDAPFDLANAACDFGQLTANDIFAEHKLGCHSIEGAWEFENLPVAAPAQITKSSWYTFTTGDYFDLLGILLETASGTALPNAVGFRLFEGNVLQSPPTSLILVETARLLDVKGEKRVRELACDTLLKPNTDYSFELLFHRDYENPNIRVRLCQFGAGQTGAPVPVAGEMSQANLLGVLPASPAGIVSGLNDHFACDASLSLPQNQCGSVNPAGGVVFGGKTYDLVTWADFELAADATVTFNYSTADAEFRYARIFSGGVGGDCASIQVGDDFFDDFTNELTVPCMPAGKYAIQLLGTSSHPPQAAAAAALPLCDAGLLGRPAALQILVKTVQNVSDFGLQDANAFDKINGLQPLVPGVVYAAAPDIFGCRNTVLPEGGSCVDRKKAIYRVLRVGQDGVLKISNLGTQPYPYNFHDIHYRLFRGNLAAMAADQTAFSETDLIAGGTDVPGDCVEGSSYYSPSVAFYCVEAGEYTLVAFGDSPQIGKEDKPSFEFRVWTTEHPSRELAQDLGNLVPPPDTVVELGCFDLPTDTFIVSETMSLTTSSDTFSCLSNADTPGGLLPCYVANYTATKLIYRQFFISEPRLVRFSVQGYGLLNLFQGKATDPADPLVPWTGLNDQGQAWQTCFYAQRTHPCFPLTAGWYTLVSYGSGASLDQPGLGGANGAQGNLGLPNAIYLVSEPLPEEKHDTPQEALEVNDCQPIDWNFAALSNAYPSTSVTYHAGTLNFGCVADLPWETHPIQACEATDLYALYLFFFVTQPSFVSIGGIPAKLKTVLVSGNAKENPGVLLANPPVYPCSDPRYGERQICNLQPGHYTLVVFAGVGNPGSIQPIFRVERVGGSRFDHALDAYDFGIVPGDNVAIFGKPGDVHPLNPALPASNDFIFCSTGAQPSDPILDRCGSDPSWNILLNPLIYSGVENVPLYLDSIPQPANNQKASLRNLWYTFVLAGSGKAEVSVNHFPGFGSGARPRLEIYRSDVNGALPFANLVANGGVDSTLADGLTFVASNRGGANNWCNDRLKTVNFDKTVCQSDTTRYYLLVTAWEGVQLNQQVEISVKYDGMASLPVKYDHLADANLINGLGETAPPYTSVALGEGTYFGAPASLECATRDATDPLASLCYQRTVWYKLTANGSGAIRLAHERPGVAGSRDASFAMKLYRETVPGDPASLQEIDLASFPAANPNNPTGHDWREGCYETGTYYVFWEDCLPADFNIFLAYRPIVWLLESPGDFCENAIPVQVAAPGTHAGQARVDCHTIGTDFGEDGSNMGCLASPGGDLKSSWFRFSITTPQRQDVHFSVEHGDLKNGLGAPLTASQVKARILYGSCVAMTAGSCLSSANASVTLNCLAPGDYYVQTVTPADAVGEVHVSVSATPALDQDCIPICSECPFANFIAKPRCTSDTVLFSNFSTAGSAVVYEWIFPDGQSSTDFLPVWVFPRNEQEQLVNVTLLVTNSQNGLTDTATQQVVIPPAFDVLPTDTLTLCNCGDTTLTLPANGADFTWQDGSTGNVMPVEEAGIYWVEMQFGNCLARDSAVVKMEPCTVFDTLATSVCEGEAHEGIVYPADTVLVKTFSDPCQNTIVEATLLTVFDTYRLEIFDTICEGSSLWFEGITYSTPGIYEASLQSGEGCDSVRVLHLTVNPTVQTADTTWLCKGETYLQSGIATDTVLCQMASGVNGCDSTHCQAVVFKDTAYVVQPVTICETETFDFEGTTLIATGFYCKPFTSIEGCDSTHCIQLTVLDTALTLLFPEICQGECFPVGDTCFAAQGVHLAVLTAANGCDSTVLTSLTVHPKPSPTISGNEPFCLGDSILLDAGAGYVAYEWSNGAAGQQAWASDSGNYSVTVEGAYGCLASDTVLANAVSLSSSVFALTDFHGSPVSCHGAADGEILVETAGGILPYQYEWSHGAASPLLTNLPTGTYSVTVGDALGCTSAGEITLAEPAELEVEAELTEPVCFGEANGIIDLLATGGTPPYQYALGGQIWQPDPFFSNLPSGVYLPETSDANGCTWDAMVFLEQPEKLHLAVSPDTSVILLGESVFFHTQTNAQPNAQATWTPAQWLICSEDDCLSAEAAPLLSTQFVLTLENANGCKASDTVFVKVLRRRDVYFPNAFSPNGDGINDHFTVYGGVSVAKVKAMKVFDRWGGLVFEAENFLPNDLSLGWNGEGKDRPAGMGVYTYWAEVELVDGVVEFFSGDVTLMH